MKRFKIKSKLNGSITNQFEADALPEVLPSGWGKPAYTALDPVLDADGNPVLGADGKPVMQERQVPAEFEIIEEDMAAEVAAAEAKKAAKAAIKERIKTHDPKKGGAGNIATILQDILDVLNDR